MGPSPVPSSVLLRRVKGVPMRTLAASTPLVQRATCARPHLGRLPLVAIAVASLSLAGCASNGQHYQSSGVTRHAAVQPPVPRPKVEIEDDGKPVQSPPARVMRPDEDDPSQPWSPNYGRGSAQPPKRVAEAIVAPPRIPATTTQPPRPDFHPAQRPLSEDEIIARAVAQHEMAAQKPIRR
jgi:hypothetical protein